MEAMLTDAHRSLVNDASTTDVLGYHRTARERMSALTEDRLGTGKKVLLWGLRGYVLFMVVVVAVQVAQTWH